MDEIGSNHARNRELRERRIGRNALYIRYLKAVSACTDCGIREGLTFDHLPQFKKEGTIADLVSKTTLPRLKREIEKCELVCEPCHRRRENERGRSNHKID